MFARFSERSMRVVRALLVVGWIALIASLVWDPITPALTDPASLASPFRLERSGLECPRAAEGGVDWRGRAPGTCDPRCVRVQGRCLVEQPYAMGPRIFWTMAIPMVPMFLLVFGHEAWRRICPLSAVSQIPRRLGLSRKRRAVDPETGLVTESLVLIERGSWLARNAWLVQFGLLWIGVSARIVLINSDRLALAIFFVCVMLAALITGLRYGGKTWCNYICPLSPVQKIYSEPRGLLESSPHLAQGAVAGSTCRTIDASGAERSACVGCKAACPDVDLERQYWTDLATPGRRVFYYGYLGLVLGFYGYYYLYAGSWDYYFSGAWTHEEDQLARALDPGFYILGSAIPIPKLAAAPLTILASIASMYGLGRLLERAYAALRQRIGRPLERRTILHHTFSASAFVTFNVFYLFGGRPNLSLLPSAAVHLIDALIVLLSTVWLVRRLGRDEGRYERESVVSTLRLSLSKLAVDLGELLGGRRLEQLGVNEVYVLAKTLPRLSAHERRRVYKETLREALASGHAERAAGASVLADLRERMGMSEEEHEAVLAELGVEDERLIDPEAARTQEDQARLRGYRAALEAMIARFVEAGRPIRAALEDPAARAEIKRAQVAYAITAAEQARILEALLGKENVLVRQGRELVMRLGALGRLDAALAERHAMDGEVAFDALRRALGRRRRRAADQLLVLVAGIGQRAAAVELARDVKSLAPRETDDALREAAATDAEWLAHASPDALAVLRADGGERPAPTVPDDAPYLADELRTIARTWDPTARAVALHALRFVDPWRAQREAKDARASGRSSPLLEETAASVEAGAPPPAALLRLLALDASVFFNHLDPEILAAIARAATTRRLAPGEVLTRQGDPSHELYYVVSGGARVSVERAGGAHEVGTVRAGETVGELGVLSRARRTATVTASDGGLEVIAIDGARLLALCAQSGRAASSFLRITGERLSRTLEHVGGSSGSIAEDQRANASIVSIE